MRLPLLKNVKFGPFSMLGHLESLESVDRHHLRMSQDPTGQTGPSRLICEGKDDRPGASSCGVMQLEGVAAVTAVQSQGYLSRLWQMENSRKDYCRMALSISWLALFAAYFKNVAFLI
jgi:hypothetical protein